jgi:hypothetical protein
VGCQLGIAVGIVNRDSGLPSRGAAED